MATSSRLNLTRDQLASFLQDHEQIKQFERLFALVDELRPTTINDLILAAGNADQKAVEALSLIASVAQEAAISSAVSDNKATRALDTIATLSQEAAISSTVLDNKATRALDAIASLSQETAISSAVADNKATQAVDAIATLADIMQVQFAVADGKASAALSQVQALADVVQDLQVVPPPREFKRSRYGSFYNTTTLVPAAINTAYGMTFNTTDISRGVYIGSPTSRIYVDETSLYDFQFSAQIDNTSGGNHIIWIWVRRNGVNIADSAGEIAVKGNDGEVVPAWNYFIELVAGDYVEIMYSVTDAAVRIAARPAVAPVPAIPSVILTVSNNILGVQ